MKPAYIISASAHYPGNPVDNQAMDQFIAPLDARCGRMKRRILAENGILFRHYAIDETGKTRTSVAQLGALALQKALLQVSAEDRCLDLLTAATTGADVSVPGFANMVQGVAKLPPLKTASLSGVCASSINALDYAVSQIATGNSRNAAVVASEIPSRLFKKSRVSKARDLQFDAHFLRWMLSDGAGCWLVSDAPSKVGLSLRVDFIHARSFSGDYPTCMQVGQGSGNTGPAYLDFPTLADAEEAGAYLLRQDIRLLPNLFDLAVNEYSALVNKGLFHPDSISHFLAHYSSERFKGVVSELMTKAGLLIDPSKWYSNLTNRGNMGSASIVTMLADFLAEKEGSLKTGQQILLFVPESGRFTVSFVGLTVVDAQDQSGSQGLTVSRPSVPASSSALQPEFEEPSVDHENQAVASVLRELLTVWHDYRSDVLRAEIAKKVFSGTLTKEEYTTWMAGWIGQVREGASWMRKAAARLPASLSNMRALIELHANEEQHDWRVLFADYRSAGGEVADVGLLRRNPGAEALNAYMHRVAESEGAAGLLGATYIIEGTGNRIVPTLLPFIKKSLGAASHSTRFLEYHGKADIEHMQRWLTAVQILIEEDPLQAGQLINTARDVAQLYALSWRHALTGQR